MAGEPEYAGFMLHTDDDVALALVPLEAGALVRIVTPDGPRELEVKEDIPLYHKFATRDLAEGTAVIKGGEAIGVTSAPVGCGMHLHIQNLKSMRYGVS